MPDEVDAVDEEAGAPWHFKFLLIAMAIYLLWRFVQLLIWAFERVF